MVNTRSIISLASLAVAMAAHAGTIQINGSASSVYARTASGTANSTSNGFAPGTHDIDSSYFSASSSSVGAAENSVVFDGTTLSGHTQVSSLASAGTNGVGFAEAFAGLTVDFELTATSNVSYGLNADADGSAITKKAGSFAGAAGTASATLYQLVGFSYVEVAKVTDTNTYVGNGVFGPGYYRISVGATSTSSASGGTLAGSLANAYSYGYGAYSLTATAVPEPTSMVALAFGGAALLRRRKKA